ICLQGIGRLLGEPVVEVGALVAQQIDDLLVDAALLGSGSTLELGDALGRTAALLLDQLVELGRALVAHGQFSSPFRVWHSPRASNAISAGRSRAAMIASSGTPSSRASCTSSRSRSSAAPSKSASERRDPSIVVRRGSRACHASPGARPPMSQSVNATRTVFRSCMSCIRSSSIWWSLFMVVPFGSVTFLSQVVDALLDRPVVDRPVLPKDEKVPRAPLRDEGDGDPEDASAVLAVGLWMVGEEVTGERLI